MKLAKLSVIAALVLGGLVTCSTLALAQDSGTKGSHKGKGNYGVEQRLEHMDKQLKLTDEQKPKVKSVLEDTSKKMHGLRDVAQDQRQAKRKEIMDDQNKQLKDILTADQYKKYQEATQHARNGKGGKKGKKSSSDNQ